MPPIERPSTGDYAPYYERYVSLVPESDALAVMAAQADELREIAAACPPERETLRYAPGKWSVREVFGHLADAERIFAYRALCIARGETAPLPGFDEAQYVANARFDVQPLSELAREFAAARLANLDVLRALDDAAWKRSGIANDSPVTLRAVPYMMAGHVRHHLRILESQYGITLPQAEKTR